MTTGDFFTALMALIAVNTALAFVMLCVVIWAITITVKWSRK